MINRKAWTVIGGVIIVSALLVGFLSLQPSAEDLLIQTIESMKTITDAHAIVEFNLDMAEQQGSGTVETWIRKGEEGFRVEVLETSEEKAVGAVVVSDGETIWAYDPSENKVLVGTPEEAMDMLKSSNMLAEKQLEMGVDQSSDFEHPESAEEAVQLLMEYFKVDNTGTETVGSEAAYLLKLVPIPDQMPDEYIAVGGFINLWIDKARSVPLAIEYTGGTLGEVSVSVISLELNTGLEDSLFAFDIPPGAEVMGFADLAPQSVSLDEATASAEFEILAPMETPEGATLVDILKVQGAIIQRYTLPDGGSFTIAQGMSEQTPSLSDESKSIEVRGVTGRLYVDEDGSRVLLTWAEGDLFYSIAGDLSADQAILIAESMQ